MPTRTAEQAGNGGFFALATATGISSLSHFGGRPGGIRAAGMRSPRKLIVVSSPAPVASWVIHRTFGDSGHSQCGSLSRRFYRDAAKSRAVWTLRDGGGYPAPKNREGVRAQPFWSSRARADRIVSTVPAYAGFDVIEVPLDAFIEEWLPSLDENGFRVGVNWSGPRAGYDIEPGSVKTALDATLGT
jgi:hypothetical protein